MRVYVALEKDTIMILEMCITQMAKLFNFMSIGKVCRLHTFSHLNL